MGSPNTIEFADSDENNSKKSKTFLVFSGVLLVAILAAIVIFVLLATRVIPIRKDGKIEVEVSDYGTTSWGRNIQRFILRNRNKMEITVITLGGTITSIRVPDSSGNLDDVVLGYKNLQGIEADGSYLGSLVGRVANRIGNGSFTLDGTTYHLDKNNGENHLHGGVPGWHKAVWTGEIGNDHVVLRHTSPDGDAGYPGEVTVNVTIQLTEQNEVIIKYSARANTKATPINLTSHPYFNLGGHASGTIYDHKVAIFADKYLPVSESLIPTGIQAPVEGTIFDLREGRKLGDVIQNVSGGGYDHNFCIRGPTGKRLTARVSHPGSGRVLTVYTDQPGVQFYTGNFLNISEGTKDGAVYGKHEGFCLETQNYPDAINQPTFPDSVLRPGSIFRHQVWYQFSFNQ